MNYTKILFELEIEDMFGEEKTRDEKIKIIERACLEAQWISLRDVLGLKGVGPVMLSVQAKMAEIEAKLKAMKP